MKLSNTLRRSSFSGFSLVELLVVIAIVALLVSVLLPVLSKARDAATFALCASTQRQLMIALSSYCTDNSQLLPPFNTVSISSTGAANAAYIEWGQVRPSNVILGANVERFNQAGGAYGDYMGLGHVIGGGYTQDADRLKGLFEPTWRLVGTNTPSYWQTAYSNSWVGNRYSTTTTATSVVWVQIGYYYRGWINYGGSDSTVQPRLDQMGSKSAIWDDMVNWNSQQHAIQVHSFGYNVGFYDGHVSPFRDEDARYTFTNVYWSEAQQLYLSFDQHQ